MRRLLFYCHHLTGLGHVARSLQIAGAALQVGGCECAFIVAGKPVRGLAWDPRIRLLDLPPMQLGPGGRLVGPDDDYDVVRHRSALIRSLLERERPDALLVDYAPLGLGGELVESLVAAGDQGWTTRFVWGLPYAEDEARTRPRNPRLRRALDAYGEVLGYSDEGWIDIFDACARFGLPPRRAYVGVVADPPLPPLPSPVPLVVGFCGSGYGGVELFELLLAAMAPLLRGGGIRARFVAGVANRAEAFEKAAAELENVEVWGQATVEEAVRDASVVVARCGYNSAYMLVQTDCPLVFVPLRLAQSTTEQHQRAEWLSRLDGVSWVDEQAPDAVARLGELLEEGLARGRVPRMLPFRTNGAENAARWLLAPGQGSPLPPGEPATP